VIKIGDIPIRVFTEDPDFLRVVQDRYVGFLSSGNSRGHRFEVGFDCAGPDSSEEDVRVARDFAIGCEADDFRLDWDSEPAAGQGRQSAKSLFALWSLRILHTPSRSPEGISAANAASAMRNGRPLCFRGSGAGKTLFSSLGLAPADATLLTDEVFDVRRDAETYFWRTERLFTGPELASLERMFRRQSRRLSPRTGTGQPAGVMTPADAVRALLESVLVLCEMRSW